MTHKQAISQFQDWFENRQSDEKRSQLEYHLDECPECQAYYDRMMSLLQRPDDDLFPELQPDPFMATRIKAIATDSGNTGRLHPIRWLKWTLVGAAASFAIIIGVEMGNSLYSVTQYSSGKEVAVTYYQACNQNGIADQWQDVIKNKEETKK